MENITRKEFQELARQVSQNTANISEIREVVMGNGDGTLADKVDRLAILIDGSSELDITGVRPSLKELIRQMTELVSVKDRAEWVVKGLIVGLGINFFAIIVTLIAIYQFVASTH